MSANAPGPRSEEAAVQRVYEVRWEFGREEEEEVQWTVEARNPDTTLTHHDWTWCQLCQRVWRTEKWVARRWRCPTQGCKGEMCYAFPWENEVFGPRPRHSFYPLVPNNGDWYPYF